MSSDRPRTPGQGATRRQVLQAGALAAGAFATPRPLTAGARAPRPRTTTPVTVVLFLRGGADALAMFAPTGDPNWTNLRPNTGIGAPGSGAAVEGLAMDATFTMHPSMPRTHAAFATPGSRCAIVHAAGYEPANRSHFESQSLYERALAGVAGGGWINRHLQATSTPNDAPVRALALRGSLPESMFGPYPCYAVSSTAELTYTGAGDQRVLLERLAQAYLQEDSSAGMQASAQSQRDTFAVLDRFSGLDPAAYQPQNGAVYPASGLGNALRQAAEVIRADLGVEFVSVDYGGWDHHSFVDDRIGQSAGAIDAAIDAFFTDLGALQQDVVLVTMSEFGRTAYENGSDGTDHGMGGAMMLRGGAVFGGVVHGVWPTVATSALAGGNYLAPVNDFRDVLHEVLQHHMGGTDPAAVFPGRVYQPIGVI